jgi:hypothetical protein
MYPKCSHHDSCNAATLTLCSGPAHKKGSKTLPKAAVPVPVRAVTVPVPVRAVPVPVRAVPASGMITPNAQ